MLQLQLILSGCSTPAAQTTMTPGQLLYAGKCGSCHRLIEPEAHSPQVWQHYVDKYGKQLSAEEKQVMLEYLTNDGNRQSQAP
ncbi:MAG: c-type cytochrome [Planctomycetota bacterium]